MEVVERIIEVRPLVAAARAAGRTVGFVPTMGALHAGHLSLVAAAREACDVVGVSIFVNPTQFGPAEDLSTYPRPRDADLTACIEAGVDWVFAPPVAELYPRPNATWVEVEGISEPLCGRSRPGHFRGVATICAKLFNIVQPDRAFFGQKDAQQALVIRRMAADLNLPLEIVVCPTVREPDGLALSSRNAYLGEAERAQAPILYRSLRACAARIEAGQRCRQELEEALVRDLKQGAGVAVEYARILDAETLAAADTIRGRVLVAVAVRLGAARLIDNIRVDVPG